MSRLALDLPDDVLAKIRHIAAACQCTETEIVLCYVLDDYAKLYRQTKSEAVTYLVRNREIEISPEYLLCETHDSSKA